jgi:two-component system, sensor histidine kinase and response regulator
MTEPTATKQRLLLVDDNPRNLTLLELRLQALGHELLFADGGAVAIELYDRHAPDLVLLDLMMPDVDGLAVLRHIRARDQHVPVILVTAHSERSFRLQGLEAGADEFLEKPIDAPILLARVNTLLRLKESRDALAASRDALAARNRDLEQLQREQRELTQFIAHDLKNQLFVVLGNLDWARHNVHVPTAELASVLEQGASGAMRLRAMVEDLLVVSNLEDATFRVRPELVPVTDIVRDVLAAYERKASLKCVSLNAPEGATGQLWGDPALIRRVLENIVDNSLRHAPSAGRVSIQTRLGRLLEISISNDGPPVPPEDRERIFEKFARGKGQAPAVGNAGLGLYFCKRAVEAHGGQIRVQETSEWPTSFVIELPTGT